MLKDNLDTDIQTKRDAASLLGNLACFDENRFIMANEGGVQILAELSASNDPELQWECACCLCNIACANERVKEPIQRDGGTKALLNLVSSATLKVSLVSVEALCHFSVFMDLGENEKKCNTTLLDHIWRR